MNGPADLPGDADRARLSALIDGYRSTALIYAAAKLGIADHLAAAPRTAEELARSLAAHAPSLRRLLRGLVAQGLLHERDDATFGLTSLGEQLQAAGGLRARAILSGEEYVAAWGGLTRTAMTGETAFGHVFGMSNWEHRRRDPDLNRCFNDEVSRLARALVPWIVSAFDFSAFPTIADIGGGNGALLAGILTKHPRHQGILFEQPHVIAAATAALDHAKLLDRCRLATGSFFESVPAGADLYVLKHILHDWDDERSAAILRLCRAAMAPRGEILVIERLMPDRIDGAPASQDVVMADLHMLAVNEGGRERSLSQFEALLGSAGLALVRALRSPDSALAVLVARPRET